MGWYEGLQIVNLDVLTERMADTQSDRFATCRLNHSNMRSWKKKYYKRCLLGPVSWIPLGKCCLKCASTPALGGTTTSLLLLKLACTQCTIRLSTSSGLTTYLLRTPYFHLLLSRYICLREGLNDQIRLFFAVTANDIDPLHPSFYSNIYYKCYGVFFMAKYSVTV